MTATGRKKLDELYHSVTERSEFYCMADLHKPPVLFTPPAEHSIDKVRMTLKPTVQYQTSARLTPAQERPSKQRPLLVKTNAVAEVFNKTNQVPVDSRLNSHNIEAKFPCSQHQNPPLTATPVTRLNHTVTSDLYLPEYFLLSL